MEYNYLPAELPVRVWEAFEEYKIGQNEVSLLLSVAWAVFVVPTERLDFIASKSPHHAGDADSETGIPKKLVGLWEEKKAKLVLDIKNPEGIYSIKNRDTLEPAGTNDWRSQILDKDKLETQQTYAELVSVLRHGLSHGNIWTDKNEEHIKNIYIANYPPNMGLPVKVLHVTASTLYTLVDEFVEWYRISVKDESGKKTLASFALEADD
tara:strand:- start:681 stop:1307 length:627 start_codon:yes stop_codon:yes gene_type:complete